MGRVAEVIWNGGYLFVENGPFAPLLSVPTPPAAGGFLRERASSRPILALVAHEGPLTIRDLHARLASSEPLTRRHKLYRAVSMLCRRGKLIVVAHPADGRLYSVPSAV